MLDYPALAAAPGTLIFFMGLEKLGVIVESLPEAGKEAATPAAVVAQGTLPEQRTVTAPLEHIVISARDARLEPPALLIVGETVSLRRTLGYEACSPSSPELAGL